MSPSLASPYAPPTPLSPVVVADVLHTLPDDLVTRDTALRVPGIKRAVQLHQSIISTMPLRLYASPGEDAELVDPQPAWLSSSASGIAPLIRTKQLVKDLVLDGWALLGCKLDGAGPDAQIIDAIAIPGGLWSMAHGRITVSETIDPAYTQRLVAIPLGDNGVLVDAIDTIRQARALDKARTNRLATPPASTELHITDAVYDGTSDEEKTALGVLYAQQRAKSSVSVTPSYIEVKEHSGDVVDLFSDATNSIRLDVANHLAVPASAIEGSKQGSGGDMSYSNDTSSRSELYDLGSRQYADAITARLSLDDVCPPGTYIAFDTAESFTTPMPTDPPLRED